MIQGGLFPDIEAPTMPRARRSDPGTSHAAANQAKELVARHYKVIVDCYRLFPRPDQLPRFAGVYCLYIGGRLMYVGSSTDVANRFCEHKLRYGYGKHIITPWGNVQIGMPIVLKVRRSVVVGDWAMWEIRLIRRLQPEFNRQHRGRKAA